MTEVEEILLYEVRQLNKKVDQLNTKVTTLKVSFAIVAMIAGFVGSFIKPYIMGHK